MQEFMAALYVFWSFINTGVNLLTEEPPTSGEDKLILFYQSAVDKALQNENGHLDLFLRFLLGLSLETNQIVLRSLLGQAGSKSLIVPIKQDLLEQTGRGSQTKEKTVSYIKEKIAGDLSQERSINLFRCLNELNDRSLVKEIQQYLTSKRLPRKSLSPAHWSAMAFILLTSEEELDVFDLKKCFRGGSSEATASVQSLQNVSLVWLPGHTGRLCFSGLSSELQPLPSERAGPELQSPRRLWSCAALCWTGGSTLETGHSQCGERWSVSVCLIHHITHSLLRWKVHPHSRK
ncbi:unnamed protein product [Gadus morhua 'NCC']